MELLKKVDRVVRKAQNLFVEIETISKTKVPIIKFRHAETGVQFDLSFNQKDGL